MLARLAQRAATFSQLVHLPPTGNGSMQNVRAREKEVELVLTNRVNCRELASLLAAAAGLYKENVYAV